MTLAVIRKTALVPHFDRSAGYRKVCATAPPSTFISWYLPPAASTSIITGGKAPGMEAEASKPCRPIRVLRSGRCGNRADIPDNGPLRIETCGAYQQQAVPSYRQSAMSANIRSSQ